ncbi:MAG: ethanolamine utilization protein EutA [Betaproteobacteria bacterium]|nr:MAG: ethanolamine utilization protein EutA [Betaproteobacteria bacterium]
MSGEAGGRIFFSNVRRSLEAEDEIRLTSVGVDIGSSTSHLVFSRLVLERLDNRYVVSERKIIHESEVLLTPFTENAADDATIDALALGRFIDRQYELAGIAPGAIDTGALILTGVAVRRSNARAIGELFASQAGKFVSVSAGDALEATLAAFGSGAAARSIRESARVMNVDLGGGTSKIAVCEAGDVVEMTAADIGARIVSFDSEGRVKRIEEAGRRFAGEASLALEIGKKPDAGKLSRMVERMADRLFEPKPGVEAAALLRLDPLRNERKPDVVTFSGGVAEYIYGREDRAFEDLGPQLAKAVLARVKAWGPRIETSDQGIRATVVGASQYTVQVSGSTIFVAPQSALPLRNLPVIVPTLPLDGQVLDAERIAQAVRAALRRLDLHEGEKAVALCYRWAGSATFARLDDFCRGIAAGLAKVLERGSPLVLVGEGDVGGLIGIHCREETRVANPIVSIDGIVLKEFDFIDIGALLETSGAVPVVIKSLVFPTAALGRAKVDASA